MLPDTPIKLNKSEGFKPILRVERSLNSRVLLNRGLAFFNLRQKVREART